MKIAYFVHDYNRHAGHSRYVAELASRFKLDHEVHIFANTWEEKDPEGITFHKVPAIAKRELLKVLSFVIPATFMAPKGFDIIHSQGLCGLRHDVTTAHIIQSCWLRESKRRGQNQNKLAWLWGLLVPPLEQLALGKKCSKRVIAISKRIVGDLEREYNIKNNIDLVYHGTDCDRFHPRLRATCRAKVRESWGLSGSEFVSLYVGNLQKGAKAAIKAVHSVPDSRLAIVTGSDNREERSLCLDLGIADKVIWIPKSKEVEIYYAASDCFVFPTFFDSFGLVISEAMASGLPVITSKNAGAADLIVHGESGFILDEPWDIAEIAKHISQLKNDPAKALEMGAAARAAIEPFTWDKCADETMKCYLQVIEDKKWRMGQVDN